MTAVAITFQVNRNSFLSFCDYFIFLLISPSLLLTLDGQVQTVLSPRLTLREKFWVPSVSLSHCICRTGSPFNDFFFQLAQIFALLEIYYDYDYITIIVFL